MNQYTSSKIIVALHRAQFALVALAAKLLVDDQPEFANLVLHLANILSGKPFVDNEPLCSFLAVTALVGACESQSGAVSRSATEFSEIGLEHKVDRGELVEGVTDAMFKILEGAPEISSQFVLAIPTDDGNNIAVRPALPIRRESTLGVMPLLLSGLSIAGVESTAMFSRAFIVFSLAATKDLMEVMVNDDDMKASLHIAQTISLAIMLEKTEEAVKMFNLSQSVSAEMDKTRAQRVVDAWRHGWRVAVEGSEDEDKAYKELAYAISDFVGETAL